MSFAAGETSKTVTINISGDTAVEPDEGFSLTLSNASGGAQITVPTAGGTIRNDDTSLAITIGEADKAEGDSGTTAFSFTVTRAGLISGVTTADYAVTGSGGNAANGADFGGTLPNGQVSFAADETSKTITINVSGDTTVEPDEGFTVALSNPSAGAQITTATANGVIRNDDTDVTVTVTPAAVAEDGAANLTYTFTRTGVTSGAIVVHFAVGGTALLATDYTQSGADAISATAGTVTIPAGATSATVTIDPGPDSVVELNETVDLTVTPAAGYHVASPGTASGVIRNDDTDVTLTVSPASVFEDDSANLLYKFERAGVTDSPLTVSFSVSGTALFNADYTATGAASFSATAGTATFAAGSTTTTVTIDPAADVTIEPDETVVLALTPAAGYNVASPGSATGKIVSDDTAVTVTVNRPTVVEDETVSLVYTFRRVGVASGPLTVDFDVAGTAGFTADYVQTGADTFTATAGTVTFAAGSSTVQVTIGPVADSLLEGNESVALVVRASAGYTVGNPGTASATIIDDDQQCVFIEGPDATVEGDQASHELVFNVRLCRAVVAQTQVDYATQDGSATLADQDYQSAAGTLVFLPGGPLSQEVRVTVNGDLRAESDEDFSVKLSNLVTTDPNMAVANDTALGVILNDDTEVAVSVTPQTVLEDGSTALVYAFTRTGVTAGVLTLDFSVSGTAAFDADYTVDGTDMFSATAGTVTFAAGSDTVVVTVDPAADGTVETDETVILTVNSGSGYTVGSPASASGTIGNDDRSSVSVAVAPASAAEDGAANLVYTFTRTNTTGETPALTVNFTIGGTATEGTDYAAVGRTVNFAAGSSTAAISVDPTADPEVEADETVTLTVNSGSDYTVGSPASASGTISNDDRSSVSVAVAPASVAEDGAANLVYTFTRTNTTARDAGLDGQLHDRRHGHGGHGLCGGEQDGELRGGQQHGGDQRRSDGRQRCGSGRDGDVDGELRQQLHGRQSGVGQRHDRQRRSQQRERRGGPRQRSRRRCGESGVHVYADQHDGRDTGLDGQLHDRRHGHGGHGLCGGGQDGELRGGQQHGGDQRRSDGRQRCGSGRDGDVDGGLRQQLHGRQSGVGQRHDRQRRS